MNPFFVIILTALLLDYTLRLVSNILNLRALKLEVPPELEGVYQPDEYRRAQEYTRALTRFDFVVSTFRLLVLLTFWFTGGFNYLDQVIRGWGFGPIVRGLLYTGVLLAANSLIMLPFSIYSTFNMIRIAKYGGNK